MRETYCQRHTQWAKAKSFPFKIRNKTSVSAFIISTQYSTGISSYRQEKEIKDIQTGKEEVKLSLIADDMIVYIENPIVSTKKHTTKQQKQQQKPYST